MDPDAFYRLAASLNDTDAMRRQITAALSTLQNSFKDAYFPALQEAAERQRISAMEHPPKEVTLLRALSAFADPQDRQRLEQLAGTWLRIHSMQNIGTLCRSLTQRNDLIAARSAEDTPQTSPLSAQAVQMAGVLLALTLWEQS